VPFNPPKLYLRPLILLLSPSFAATMSTLEDLDAMEQEGKEDKKDEGDKDGKKPGQDGDAEMKDADGDKKEEEAIFDPEILHSSTRDIVTRRRLLENDMRIMKSEFQRLTHEQAAMKEKIKDNLEKIENNRGVYGVWSALSVC